MAIGLAASLRFRTTELHSVAEQTGIMAELIQGRVSLKDYAILLRNLYEIYERLERGLQRHQGHERLAPFAFLPLARTARLCADLDCIHGLDWRRTLPIVPATVAYRERLSALSDTQPDLLVSHAYVRYLGDLHGGQTLGSMVAKGLSLSPPDGVRFYQFEGQRNIAQLIAQFRGALDTTPCSQTLTEQIVTEAQDAFRRHVAIFEQLIDA
jgi:heme oxygenase (biliverdin-producing, ferredoxin)